MRRLFSLRSREEIDWKILPETAPRLYRRTSLPAFAVFTVAMFLAASSSFAALPQFTKRVATKGTRSLPLDPGGSLFIENPSGRIDIVGTDGNRLLITAVTTFAGVDAAAIREARQHTVLAYAGDTKRRYVRATMRPFRTARWATWMDLVIQVPHSANIDVSSFQSELIRARNLTGILSIKNARGRIELTSVYGPLAVDTGNGSIMAEFARNPRSNVRLTTVNGQIELRVPAKASIQWTAETFKGEIMSALPVRGGFAPQNAARIYHASLNSSRGPRIYTASFMGRIFLLPVENPRAIGARLAPANDARASALHPQPLQPNVRRTLEAGVGRLLIQKPAAASFVVQREMHNGDFELAASIGNVFIGDIQGDAHVTTGAGEIALGRVQGKCAVRSLGGPLNLGDVYGVLDARTNAGNILVRSSRKGGFAWTGAGSIQVLRASAPISLQSGGGDINLRIASASVKAETRSGDITVGVDPMIKSQAIQARSIDGNIVVTLPAGFAADVEATILTSPGSENTIVSDIPGLSILRETAGKQIRIRAVGKINGGGQKLDLYAENGNIQIRSRPSGPRFSPTPTQ